MTGTNKPYALKLNPIRSDRFKGRVVLDSRVVNGEPFDKVTLWIGSDLSVDALKKFTDALYLVAEQSIAAGKVVDAMGRQFDENGDQVRPVNPITDEEAKDDLIGVPRGTTERERQAAIL